MDWLTILIAGGFCLCGAITWAICWLTEWSDWAKEATKISFKKFKQFYNINPDRWRLDDFVVIYRFNSFNRFYFNPIDFWRYRSWHKKIERKKTKTKKDDLDAKALSLLISGVTLDIEELKSKGAKEIEEAKQSILTAQTIAQDQSLVRYLEVKHIAS